MNFEEIIHRLRLFGIPVGGTAENVERARKILARLVEAESLDLSDLQIARDIARRIPDIKAEANLFLAAMFLSLRDGNTFLRPEKGRALLEKGGHLDEPDESGYAHDDYLNDVATMWPVAEQAAEALAGDVILKRRDNQGSQWFFQRNANAVDAVSNGFKALAAKSSGDSPLSPEELAAATAFEGFTLNKEQIDAVNRSAERLFTVITGGPGTGKTTIVCAILRSLIRRGLSTEDIALAAPTGRAAQRMGEALRKQCASAKGLDDATRIRIEALKGTTLHALLGGFPPHWKYTAENKLPLRLVVVDEASMVDVMLMKALVDALPGNCRLVLLGDRDQLPSVDAGAVLGDVVDNGGLSCVVRLKESIRFSGALAKCAEAIRAGRPEDFAAHVTSLASGADSWTSQMESADAMSNCFRLSVDGNGRRRRDDCHKAVIQWATHHGLLEKDGALVRLASDTGWEADPALTAEVYSKRAKALFDALDRSRILTVVRHGPYGVQSINDLLVTRRFGGKSPRNPLSKAGVPVIVTRNTPVRSLFNGDIGVTVKAASGLVVLFPRGDKVVCCPVALLPEHELAYAITVHKSQGSEYENVLVVLPDDATHPLLSRQLVYTGITRAKKRAVILGTKDALEAAIQNEIRRDTGIVL